MKIRAKQLMKLRLKNQYKGPMNQRDGSLKRWEEDLEVGGDKREGRGRGSRKDRHAMSICANSPTVNVFTMRYKHMH